MRFVVYYIANNAVPASQLECFFVNEFESLDPIINVCESFGSKRTELLSIK